MIAFDDDISQWMVRLEEVKGGASTQKKLSGSSGSDSKQQQRYLAYPFPVL
jgi:hypothetical protein